MAEPNWKDTVSEWFSRDKVAGDWDTMYRDGTPKLDEHAFRLRRDFAVRLVQERIPQNGRILDLGCGTGALLSGLLQTGRDAVGLDYAPDMLTLARQRLQASGHSDHRILRGDASRLPFPTGIFDAVLCLGVISYQPDYLPVLREIRRVLNPSGNAVALVTFRNVYSPVASDPWEGTKALGRWLLRRQVPRDEGFGRRLDPRVVRADLLVHGLEPEAFEGIGLGPPKLAGRALARGRAAIRFSDGATHLLTSLGAAALVRWAGDVSMFVCRPR